MGKIKLDTNKLNKVITNSFDHTIDKFSNVLDEAMNDDLYDWPRETRRRNGEIAGSPRSIVDTGALIESKVIARSSSSNSVEFSWDAPYASAVRNGCTLRNGTEMPERKWDEKALELCNVPEVFENAIRRQL